VQQFMIAGPAIGYGIAGGLTFWTMRFARRSIRPASPAAKLAAPD
jgi:hypothetical protein